MILDELDKAGADLLFGFISQRYERRSLVVTTNLPFARWSEVFLDPTAAAAVIDRVVHHATVLPDLGQQLQAAGREAEPGTRPPERSEPVDAESVLVESTGILNGVDHRTSTTRTVGPASVTVCSPASRRAAARRPRCAGLRP